MAVAAPTVVVARGDLQMNLASIRRDVGAAAGLAAEEVVKTAQDLAPKDTGVMAEGIEVYRVYEDKPGLWRVEIIGREPYTAAQERGSGSRADWSRYRARTDIVIKPIPPNTLLRFWWQGVQTAKGPQETGYMKWIGADRYSAWAELKQPMHGYWAIFPEVHHPGVYGQHFMRDAVRQHTVRIWTRILEAVKRP